MDLLITVSLALSLYLAHPLSVSLLRGFPVLRGLYKPILIAGLTEAQGGPRKECIPKSGPGSQH